MNSLNAQQRLEKMRVMKMKTESMLPDLGFVWRKLLSKMKYGVAHQIRSGMPAVQVG